MKDQILRRIRKYMKEADEIEEQVNQMRMEVRLLRRAERERRIVCMQLASLYANSTKFPKMMKVLDKALD